MTSSTKRKLKQLLDFLNSFLLSKLALKLVTNRSPNRDFREFFNHLRSIGYEAKTVIDVGVGFGTTSLYAGNPNAKFVLIEAVPDDRSIVGKLARDLNAEFHNVAAGDIDGELTFNLHDDVTGSSSFSQVESTGNLDGRQINVPSRRLDNLLTDSLEAPVLLKIDTQGAELSVLKGASGIIDKIDMIIAEVSFHEFRHGAPEVAEVVTEFEKANFVPYEILEGHYRYVDNAMAQVDIVFVKRSSALRKQKGFFSPEQLAEYKKGNL